MTAAGSVVLSKKELERYSRQLVLPEVGVEGQRRLKSSKALVVGVGGLGIPASTYLAAAGVGEVGIIDHDVVEVSNIHRQPLYSEGDTGRRKVEVARERLSETNPNVTVTTYGGRLDRSNALEIIRRYDVVLDCTDNFPTRYLVNDACVMAGKPDVYASVFRFDGQSSVFATKSGPCYRCLFPVPPPPGAVQDCAESGVMGVLPGLMGTVQAAQALNILLGNGRALVGRLLLFSGSEMTFDEVKVRKDPECPVCSSSPRIRELIDYDEFCGLGRNRENQDELGPSELKRLLDSGTEVVLLDVREPYERQLCSLAGSRHIPLGELVRRAGELDRDDELVVYCHVGVRSAAAVSLLKSLGFRSAKSLAGGIRAWAEEVDPSIPVY
ncbi:MAG: molybdopterin-synthase adenylyltransferase MoeB [Nitrososphaerota archaeon]|nr:molybdopterin-synthase adenylyltransferase MoeB [Nitrososphaerota archaeon]